MIVDSGGNTLTFQRDEDLLISHLESIVDHKIVFENENTAARQKQVVPVLNVKPGQHYINQA
jgi:hypothetical protein